MAHYRLTRADVPRAVDVLSDAFNRDPLWNRIFERYLPSDTQQAASFEMFLRMSLCYGEVRAPSADLEGVALWLPAELSGITLWRLLRSGALGAFRRIGSAAGRKLDAVFGPVERDRLAHTSGWACDYLQALGVRSELQGQGHGGALLKGLLETSDASGRHVYLETETEPNVAFYEKYGFRVVKQIDLPLVELPMWEMHRAPS